MSEILILSSIEATVTIIGLCGLVYYRIKRKFKQEKPAGFWDFLDRNFTECIFFGILVPDWSLILKLF